MGLCPKCGKSIDHDFGVVVCSGCESVLFSDFDGNLQVSGGEADAVSGGEADAGESLAKAGDGGFSPPPSQEFATPANEHDFQNSTDQFSEQGPQLADENYAASSEPQGEVPTIDLDLSATESPEAADAFEFNEPEVLQTPAEQMQEVVDYGNSSPDQGHALQYTLIIDQIDSKETRQSLFEILSDIRLGLSVRDLQAKLSKGRLEIDQLNPVRASVIVARLRELPIQVRWKQDVWKS